MVLGDPKDFYKSRIKGSIVYTHATTMRFLPIVTAALLSLFCQTLAAPAPQASETLSPQPTTCRIPDYRSFKLWATRKDTGERYPVRLLREDWRNATVSDPSQAEKKELRSYAIVNTAKYEIEIYVGIRLLK